MQKMKQVWAARWPLLRTFFRGQELLWVLNALQILLWAALTLMVSWFLQQVIDLTLTPGEGTRVVELLLLCAGVLLLNAGCDSLNALLRPRLRAKAMERYKGAVMERLLRKEITAFARENSGGYLNALTTDALTIDENVLNGVMQLVSSALDFVGAIVLMLWYSPILTGVTLGLSVLPVVAALITGGKTVAAEKAVSDRQENFLSLVKDMLTGFPVLKAFRAEKALQTQFDQSNRDVESARSFRRRIGILLRLIGDEAGLVTQLGVILVGSWMAARGMRVTAGVVVAFIQLSNAIVYPISSIPQHLASIRSGLALIDKVTEQLDHHAKEPGKALPVQLEEGIQLQQLRFAYEPGGREVLQGMDLTLEMGRSYALVGASGSGKSTLLNLLMAGGGYQGQICYDGQELRDVSAASLYEAVSLIQQQVFLFNSSIRDNITLFQDFPEEALDRAIRLSGLEALVRERGLDFPCGENGCKLSGGEKQRIAIARSLLRRCRVLLADEATANLDAQTAHQVLGSILGLQDMLRVVVLHGLDEGVLSRFDSIITLRNGTVAEMGSFRDLMAKKGYFYSLYTVNQQQ